jgi:hypothetical protein
VSHLNLPWFQLKLRFCFGRPEIKPFVGVGVVGGLEHRRTKKGGPSPSPLLYSPQLQNALGREVELAKQLFG